MKILTVDDDPLILKFIRQTMMVSGYSDVTLARSAVDAAQIIAEADPPFDCFLIDKRMPEIEGDDLCYWVRQLPDYAYTPILMVTALSDKMDIDRAFLSGASDYITKPIDPLELISRIKKVEKILSKNGFDAGHNPALCDGKRGEIDHVNFAKPILLGGVKSEIDVQSLENYVLQLSRKNILNVDAFAFAIKDAAAIHFLCTRIEYLNILRQTAKAISTTIDLPGLFISHAGYGTFIGVINSCELEVSDWMTLEFDVKSSLKDVFTPSRCSKKIGVFPYSSMPLRLGPGSGKKAIDKLYRVIVDAEERAKSFKKIA